MSFEKVEIGTATLYRGDCLEIMPMLADKSVDLIFTDPPYGINYQSARRTDKSQWKPKIENDKEPFTDWISETHRIANDPSALICFCRWDVEQTFRIAIDNAGYTTKSQIIWDKVVHGMGDLNGQFAPQHENAWFASKGDFHFWAQRPKTIVRVKRVEPEKLSHPNEKPVPLAIRLVESVCPPPGIVADLFMGSGTTGVACAKLGRKFIGVEISQQYFDIACKRIEAAQAQMRMELTT